MISKGQLIEKAVIDLNGELPDHKNEHYAIAGNVIHRPLFPRRESLVCTIDEFKAATDRMRGKPDWKDAPEWAQWLAQNNAGDWWWYPAGESPELIGACFANSSDEARAIRAIEGVVLGDWRNTLEKRPEQKADPLNGYKWGVEYPTNGKKPALPDDVEIEYKNGFHGDLWVAKAKVGHVYFCADFCGVYPVNFFRITDQRYKPELEPEPAPAKPWFDVGELPPVGTKCLCYFDDGRECWHECVVIGSIDDEIKNGYLAASLIGKHERKLIWVNDFKPIKTDKEKAIEFALSKIHNGMNRHAAPYIIEQLYDAGLLRLPDQK